MKSLELSELDRLMLDNYLIHLESLDTQIERVDDEITSKASVDGEVRILMSLTGISVYSALLIKSEIGTIERFAGYKKLVSWLGWLRHCINQETLSIMEALRSRVVLCLGGLWLRRLGWRRIMILG